MNAYRTGVHTAELTFDKGGWIEYESLPKEYRSGIEAIDSGRYKLKIPRLPGLEEYNDIKTTQDAIDKALTVYTDTSGTSGRITRIDYRLDDYKRSYEEEFAVMRALIVVIAYKHGMQDRLHQMTNPATGERLSIRYMPDENTDGLQMLHGAEFYNKPAQSGTNQYGNARLELRMMNLNGESVQDVLNKWEQTLTSIKRRDYLEVMKDCARHLFASRMQDERMRDFSRRVARDMIGKEEERYLYALAGKELDKEGLCSHPTYSEVREKIKQIQIALK